MLSTLEDPWQKNAASPDRGFNLNFRQTSNAVRNTFGFPSAVKASATEPTSERGHFSLIESLFYKFHLAVGNEQRDSWLRGRCRL